MRNGPSAVLTPKDGACLHAWSPAVSRTKRSNRHDRHSCAAVSCTGPGTRIARKRAAPPCAHNWLGGDVIGPPPGGRMAGESLWQPTFNHFARGLVRATPDTPATMSLRSGEAHDRGHRP